MDSVADQGARVLPAGISTLLDGADLAARIGFTLQLVTVDESGWPRVALLSVGEVVALDDHRLRLALWPGSRTTANLTRSGVADLAFVDQGAFHTVRIGAARRPDLTDPVRAVFDADVIEARHDEVPYASITGGIVFDLAEPDPVLGRWRATVDALLARGSA